MNSFRNGYVVINGLMVEASVSPERVEEEIGDVCAFHNLYMDADRETFEFHDILVEGLKFDVLLDYEEDRLYRICLSRNHKTDNLAVAHNVLFTEDMIWLEKQLGKHTKAVETKNVPILKEQYLYPYRTHNVSLNWVYDIRTNVFDIFIEITFKPNAIAARYRNF